MDEFESKIYEYVMKNHMIVPGGHVTVGVSGGADSMCLLFVLLDVYKRQEKKPKQRVCAVLQRLCRQISGQ